MCSIEWHLDISMTTVFMIAPLSVKTGTFKFWRLGLRKCTILGVSELRVNLIILRYSEMVLISLDRFHTFLEIMMDYWKKREEESIRLICLNGTSYMPDFLKLSIFNFQGELLLQGSFKTGIVTGNKKYCYTQYTAKLYRVFLYHKH